MRMDLVGKEIGLTENRLDSEVCMMKKEIELIVDSCYKGKRVGFGTEFNFDNHKVD